ncbi:unnamed protein product [Meganyctiphanes norvegica]|uniref:RRM domain-containing protein n=1 Tax=Meganyctiphanes norvegica TaxID=48144 RepID=A0AAV2Q9B0_MEGNR
MDSKDDLQYQDSPRDRSRSRSPSENERETRDRDSDRDRDRRRDRTDRRRNERSRSSVSKSSGGRRAPAERRIYVSNIPYEYKWQDLKDLFRKEVGEVSYVEMFNDENNRPRGCAIIEFDTNDLVNKAIDVMHRHELKGRKLVVKEDFDTDRDGHGRIMKGGGGGRDRDMSSRGSVGRNDFNNRNMDAGPPSMGGGGGMGMGMGGGAGIGGGSASKFGNTYGLSTVFLESLGINGPLVNKVFVANLDYKVDEKNLKDVFRIAGKVTEVEINKDQDGKSRGFGVVQFEHPVEAVQAISMLHNQSYFDRKMSVRMDRVSEKQQDSPISKLPAGLKSLGMGLGVNGSALNDVSTINTGMSGSGGMGAGMGGMTAGMGGAMGNTGMGGGMGTGMGMMGAMGNNMGGGMDSMAASNIGMGNMGGGMGAMGVGGMGNMGGSMVPGMGAGMAGGMGAGMAGGMGAGMAGGMAGGMGMGTAGMVTPVGTNMGMGTGMNSGMGSNMNRGGGMGGNSNNSISSSTGYGNYSRGSSGVSRDYGHANNSNSSGNFSGTTQRNIIQIGNLPLDYTWQSLRDLCREFGEIRFAEIRSKGTGTVRFQSDADARRAVEMLDRQRLDGRILDVSHV